MTVAHTVLDGRLAVGWQVDDNGALAAITTAARNQQPLDICNQPTIGRLAELSALARAFGFDVRWHVPAGARTATAWVTETGET